jgi:hypothetical protein
VKISIKDIGETKIETDSRVELREVFDRDRVVFVAEDGERLEVVMREAGFEIRYSGHFDGGVGFDAGLIKLKNGTIDLPDKRLGEVRDEDSA